MQKPPIHLISGTLQAEQMEHADFIALQYQATIM
jgi:hypothetical protein